MKKTGIALLVAFLIVTSLVGCGKETDTGVKCKEVLSKVLEQVDTKMDTTVVYGEDIYEKNFETLYNFPIKEVVDGGISYAATGGLADEISIVHVKSDKEMADAKGYMQARIQKRIKDFTGYKPDEVKKLESAKVIVHKQYIALIINENVDAIEAAIRTAIS